MHLIQQLLIYTENRHERSRGTIYGRGGEAKNAGALRGKMLGSRLLAVSSVDEMISQANADLVEVSQLAGTECILSWKKRYSHGRTQSIRDMREAFCARKVTGE